MHRSLYMSLVALSLLLTGLAPLSAYAENPRKLKGVIVGDRLNAQKSASNPSGAPMLAGATNGTIGSKGTIEGPLKDTIIKGINSPDKGYVERPVQLTPQRGIAVSRDSLARRAAFRSAAPLTMSKMGVETPLKTMINPSFGAPASSIPSTESPTMRVTPKLIKRAAPKPVLQEEVTGIDDKGNEKVRPGAVTWHKDFDESRSASSTSGKPVLMFAMIGSLDDKFC